MKLVGWFLKVPTKAGTKVFGSNKYVVRVFETESGQWVDDTEHECPYPNKLKQTHADYNLQSLGSLGEALCG